MFFLRNPFFFNILEKKRVFTLVSLEADVLKKRGGKISSRKDGLPVLTGEVRRYLIPRHLLRITCSIFSYFFNSSVSMGTILNRSPTIP